MFKYEVTAQDGTVYTRKSDRTYTHAVVGTWNDGNGFGTIAMCGSYDLAVKRADKYNAASFKAKYPGSFWEIVEVRVAA